MMRALVAVGLVLGGVSVLAVPAAAQRGEAGPVPRELVIALLGSIPGDTAAPRLLVGAAPTRFQPPALPAGWRVLGALDRDDGATVALAAPVLPDSARATVEAALLAGGWTRLEPPGAQRGFVASDRPFTAFCHGDDVWTTVSASPAPGSGSHVRLMYQTTQEFSPCSDQRRRERSEQPPFPGDGRAMLPRLEAPPGVRLMHAGMSAGNGTASTHSRVEGSASTRDLLSAFGEQLRAAGWSAAGQANAGGAYLQTWTKPDERGKPWLGLLTAVEVPGTEQRLLTFQATDLSADRLR